MNLDFNEEDQAILQDFVQESKESIENTEQILLGLDDAIANGEEFEPELIDKIFRTFHSIKGSAGFIGLTLTNSLTHKAETVLDMVRKGKATLVKSHIDIFLELCDFFNTLLDHIQNTFSESGFEEPAKQLETRLEQYLGKSEPAGTAETNPAPTVVAEPQVEQTAAQDQTDSLITPELVDQFVIEARELMDQLEQDLLALEKSPTEKELIESAFRAMHSIKGNAGLLGLQDIQSVCHRAESFLDEARNGQRNPKPENFNFILEVFDFVRKAVDFLPEGKPALIPGKNALIDLMAENFGPAESTPPSQPEPIVPNIDLNFDPDKAQEKPLPEPEEKKDSAAKRIKQLNKDMAIAANEAKPSKQQLVKGNRLANEVIRVDVNKLNAMMDLVGEIVIAESMVAQHPDIVGRDIPDFEKSVQHLQKNIRELQELATSMRMIPLQGLFSKMRRLVRDISMKSNKKADLIISGGETEVDRSVLEHISDPLVHIFRNSVDHGIEQPEKRVEQGKPETGHIYLEAKQIGGEIWISIKDDGAGLNRERILAKAAERGLLTEPPDEIPDERVWKLIFAPGFSTAAKVTNISGRGVGMDVVIRNIEKIRGRVDVDSKAGEGTTITLRIPLTTAIVDGMMMRVEDAIYAVPTLDIRESLQIQPDKILKLIDGQEVVKIRDRLVPILRIDEIHEIERKQEIDLDKGILVVVGSDEEQVCLYADELIGQKQLVIKALPTFSGNIEGVSGCAILGNGEICLILDVSNLIKLSKNAVNQEESVEA